MSSGILPFTIFDHGLHSAESPVEVSATGIGHVNGAGEDTAYVSVFYSGSIIAHLNVNWLSPVKIRRTLIGGTKSMIVYDDIESSEKIKVYDKGVVVKNGPESLYKMMVSYRSGDMYTPRTRCDGSTQY